ASAAVVLAWYLAAARNEQVVEWLRDKVIVIEPVLNPDGLDRFTQWVNRYRGRHPVADPADIEHNEAWPNGRTNYYWFDLNRDWLPLVHPESRARMAVLREWVPHLVADFHEMGPNSTYFFQPGVPERNNPLTPARNFELTASIAEYHARILDRAGEPFYTRETFDDYYPGKGSTYPDLTGGIGILFEQGSARGHVQDTDYGRRTFAEAVANQVRTSLSTLEAGHALSDELVAYQQGFFESAREQARNDRRAGWVLADDNDPARAHALIDLLLSHSIEIRPVQTDVDIAGATWAPGSAWVIPAAQDHYRLLKSIFEPVTDLPMETFYDVSSWPLAMAFDLPIASVKRLPDAGEPLSAAPSWTPSAPLDEALAWLVPWDQYRAPAVLAALLAEGYKVQVLTETARPRGADEQTELVRGSLLLHSGLQDDDLPAPGRRLAELAGTYGIEVLATSSGLSAAGPDLGSPSAPVLQPIRPALLVGEGLRANHAGYIWHWFDTRLDQALTRLNWSDLHWLDLSGYTHLILPDGGYGRLSASQSSAIADFVRRGGTVIAARNAAAWVETLDLDWDFAGASEDEEDGQSDETSGTEDSPRAYGDFRDDFARDLIGGSAMAIEIDTSHPLAYGYRRSELTVFRRGRHELKPIDNAYAHAGRYAAEPLAAGYLSASNRERLQSAPALVASRHGRGTVIRMADDYLFRGYWLGSEKLFANALFFSQLIGPTRLPDSYY
ncbi:MAG: M14 family metallopeptidase, partial [Wenzhouxiangella sp.]|nr:M14 family metallopeptidase [Wenzhouxiangella sp.]